jgi:FMN phosphatase YigB (HAD superfamily)
MTFCTSWHLWLHGVFDNLCTPMPSAINLIVVDYGMTLSSALYFRQAPPDCPLWAKVVEQAIFGSEWFDRWMAGEVSVREIAAYLTAWLPLSPAAIEAQMRAGCQGLALNRGVVAFVCEQRARGRKTALVTANIDLFTQVIVPDQGLAALFDVIVNSYEHRTTDKAQLWAAAYRQLGSEYGCATSFLLEDSALNVAQFVALGGQAHRYAGDDELEAWLEARPDWDMDCAPERTPDEPRRRIL